MAGKKLLDKIKNVLSFEVVELVLGQWNLVDNPYQQKSDVLYPFTTNKSHAELLNVEPKNLVL